MTFMFYIYYGWKNVNMLFKSLYEMRMAPRNCSCVNWKPKTTTMRCSSYMLSDDGDAQMMSLD